MPTEHNQTTNNSLDLSVGSSSVTYRFRVKYYNEADCAAKIGDVFYNTVSDACAVGGEVILLRDVVESVVVPASGKLVDLVLNGHTITSTDDNTITNSGTLIIRGDGCIDCVAAKKAAIQNYGECQIGRGVELTRSNDTAESTTATSGYVIQNFNKMVIEDKVNVHTAGKATSLVVNGWYDTKTATDDDKAVMTVHGGTFNGGKIGIKNDELGELTLYGGEFFGSGSNNNNSIQNWHIMTIEDGTYIGVISTGTYGKGIGRTVIKNGDFVNANITTSVNYPSDDITIYGGKFNTIFEKINDYLADGYHATEQDGILIVEKMDVYQQVDNVIGALDEKGIDIVEDGENTRQYNVTVGAPSFDTVIDEVASVDGIKKITISAEGTDVAYEYIPGDDLEEFKGKVNSMLPTSNTDPEVILVMTVE